MYEQPVLFPAISNRETWLQTIQVFDDETGDLISLIDSSGSPFYQIYLEISPPRHHGYSGGYSQSGWYGDYCEPEIFASLADYIAIVDTGTIQIQIPYTVMQKMRGSRTYDVYLRMEQISGDFNADFNADFNGGTGGTGFQDARQILIGKLPIYYGGRGP